MKKNILFFVVAISTLNAQSKEETSAKHTFYLKKWAVHGTYLAGSFLSAKVFSEAIRYCIAKCTKSDPILNPNFYKKPFTDGPVEWSPHTPLTKHLAIQGVPLLALYFLANKMEKISIPQKNTAILYGIHAANAISACATLYEMYLHHHTNS